MKAYWNNLNERERWLLGAGGVVCFCYLLYLLIFAPLIQAVHDKSQQLIEKKETLAWMQQAHQQHKTGNTPKTLSKGKLLSELANQLKSTPFHHRPYQLQQTGTGEIQLSFDKIPYNAFVAWLWSMSQRYVFTIKQFNTERTSTPGVVKLMVTMQANTP